LPSFTASDPIKATILERREDGSLLVEVPILVVTPRLDLSKTDGGGKGSISIGEAELDQMVENFSIWPKPVAMGFDGLDGHQDQRGGPQLAFVKGLRRRGANLFARVELDSLAADLFTRFRATSIEALRNPKTPTGSFTGWVATGGIFTNSPAADTTFEIAAGSEAILADLRLAASCKFNIPADGREESEMPNTETAKTTAELQSAVSLAEDAKKHAEGSMRATEEKLHATQTKLSASMARNVELDADLAEAQSKAGDLKTSKLSLEAKVENLERETSKLAASLKATSDEAQSKLIRETAAAAVESGMSAAYFEGVDDDPLAWFTAKGFTNVKALEDLVELQPKVEKVSATSAGRKPTDAPDTLPKEARDKLERLGLGDSKYDNVENEGDLIPLRSK